MENKIAQSVAEAKEKILKLKKDGCIVIPLFTDLHTANVEAESAQNLIEILKGITSSIECEFVADIGDNLCMLGRDEQIPNDKLEKVLTDLFTEIYKATGIPLVTANGNHDGIGTDFFKPVFWNNIVKGKFGNTDAVYDDEGSYYYLDCEKADTRFIVLSLPSESDLEAEHPTPIWCFGEKQLSWLENTALDTDKNVIIITHVPIYDEYMGDRNELWSKNVWDGHEKRISTIFALCGGIADREEAARIFNEFNKKSGGKLRACFSGHTHSDSLYKPFENTNKFPNPLSCHQIVTKGVWLDSKEYGFSVDVVVWNPDEGKIDIVRIGDGEDRSINV